MRAASWEPAGLGRAQRLLGQSGRLRGGVAVERRLAELVVAEPEPGADHLMRVRLPGDRVRAVGQVGSAVGEPGDRDVHGVPEVVHRAGLGIAAAGELLQHQRHLPEDLPVPVGVLRDVGSVLGVLGERRAVGQVEGLRLGDPDLVADRGQRIEQLAVEPGHRQLGQAERHLLPGAALDPQQVLDEVEIDREEGVRAHRPRREPAGGHMERDVPPVIAQRTLIQADLAGDLQEAVQRLLGVLPLSQRHRREQHGHDFRLAASSRSMTVASLTAWNWR